MTYTRKYDALERTDVPNEYIGLEHKVNNSPLTPNQKKVDDLVNSGVPAYGTLNGEAIKVVETELIRVNAPPDPNPAPPSGAAPGAGISEGAIPPKVIESAPKGVDDWGTPITREDMTNSEFPWNVFEKFLPSDPNDPKNHA